jgi:serine/threonine protein phosphatase PrpC
VPVVSAALTDLGLRRPANEDSYVSRPGLGLYAVCDGMGGHAAGEVASRVAADTIEAFVQQTDGVTADFAWPFRYNPDWGVDGNRLVSALLLANRTIAQRVVDEPALRGMATTAVCLLLGTRGLGPGAGEEEAFPPVPSPQSPAPNVVPALVAHVGDSRAYLWRGGELDQITRDHSWVEEQIALGVLSETEARQHPWRNLVTRALAGAEEPRVELSPVALAPGDRVLLCSDGLTSPLNNAAIAWILSRTPAGSPGELCQALVDAANAAGGPDNITVIVVEVT